MSIEYLIRKLSDSDYSQYLELINDFRPSNFNEIEFKENLKKINLSSDIWIIEKDSKIIATGTIIYENKFIFNICKCCHIEDICVKKELRNFGYGKIMMNYLINEATKNKCYKINLVCNKDTSKFYKSCNFEERGVQMSYLIEKK